MRRFLREIDPRRGALVDFQGRVTDAPPVASMTSGAKAYPVDSTGFPGAIQPALRAHALRGGVSCPVPGCRCGAGSRRSSSSSCSSPCWCLLRFAPRLAEPVTFICARRFACFSNSTRWWPSLTLSPATLSIAACCGASSFCCPPSSWAASSVAGSAPWAPCSTSSATCRPSPSAASSALNPTATSAGKPRNMWF